MNLQKLQKTKYSLIPKICFLEGMLKHKKLYIAMLWYIRRQFTTISNCIYDQQQYECLRVFLTLLAVLENRTCWLPCFLTVWWIIRKIFSIFILFCRNLCTLRIVTCIHMTQMEEISFSSILFFLTWYFPLINRKQKAPVPSFLPLT